MFNLWKITRLNNLGSIYTIYLRLYFNEKDRRLSTMPFIVSDDLPPFHNKILYLFVCKLRITYLQKKKKCKNSDSQIFEIFRIFIGIFLLWMICFFLLSEEAAHFFQECMKSYFLWFLSYFILFFFSIDMILTFRWTELVELWG